VTIFYTAPTAIRAFMKWGDEVHQALRPVVAAVLGTVGEPINPEAWMWYRKHIGGGSCPIVDTWWQTETGAIMITPLPGVTPTKPGSATGCRSRRRCGVVDDDRRRVRRTSPAAS
jgi:acetyl-CoA synthetase